MHFTDPACPFAFSAEPVRLRLRWHYGEQLRWTTRMIVLTLEPGEAEKLAEGAPTLQRLYGMPIDPRNFHRMFKARARKAGVPEISVHSARRTCASLLVALNVHPRVAMAILRHSQIAVTMDVYSQATAEGTRNALRDLGAAIGDGQR